MRFPRSLFCSLLLLLAGCSSTNERFTRRAEQPIPNPEPYVRLVGVGTNRVELQIAVRKFLPLHRRGPAIWLAGVSHLGETNYFAALQSLLNTNTLVLFEGVGGSGGDRAITQSERRRQAEAAGPLQTSMARALGLVFQLAAIDYGPPNFRNSDLTVSELRAILEAQPTGPDAREASRSFEQLLELMQGESFLNLLLQFGMRFVEASPKLQGLSRLALMQAIELIQGDPSRIAGLPESMKPLLETLIQKRNQKVVADLKQSLTNRGNRGSIAVLYGAAHMADLERRVRAELGFRPAGEVWLMPFAVDFDRTGISEAERKLVENLVRGQLQPKTP